MSNAYNDQHSSLDDQTKRGKEMSRLNEEKKSGDEKKFGRSMNIKHEMCPLKPTMCRKKAGHLDFWTRLRRNLLFLTMYLLLLHALTCSSGNTCP